MITLPLRFESGDGGYPEQLSYVQLERTASTAIYQRFYSDGRPKDFEVFLIKVDRKGKVKTFPAPKKLKAQFPKGISKTIEEDTENYPSCGQFGKIAWSYQLRLKNAAFAKFKELQQSGTITTTGDDVDENSDHSVIATGNSVETAENQKYLDMFAQNKIKILNIPAVEFSTNELADFNKVQYPIAFLFLKYALAKSMIRYVRDERRNAKGKATKIYTKA